MADFGKLGKSRLGAPPPSEDASTNLTAPEQAPAEAFQRAPRAMHPDAPVVAAQAEPVPAAPSSAEPPRTPPAAPASPSAVALAPEPRSRRDGRSLRRTNRTIAFATRVSADWDFAIRTIAERDGLMLVEVLERALDAYERERHRPRRR